MNELRDALRAVRREWWRTAILFMVGILFRLDRDRAARLFKRLPPSLL